MTTLMLVWPSPALARRFDPLAADAVEVPVPTAEALTGGEPWYWTSVLAASDAAPDDLDAGTAMRRFSGDDGSESAEGRRHSGLTSTSHCPCRRRRAPSGMSVAPERPTTSTRRWPRSAGTDRATSPGAVSGALPARPATSRRAGSGKRPLRWRRHPQPVQPPRVDAVARPSDPGHRLLAGGAPVLPLGQPRGGPRRVPPPHRRRPTDPTGLDDEKLLAIAPQARTAMTARPSRYMAFDPLHPRASHRVPVPVRASVRQQVERPTTRTLGLPEIRAAFNSPFWPFVLATTSIGQEGIDFHWWCHRRSTGTRRRARSTSSSERAESTGTAGWPSVGTWPTHYRDEILAAAAHGAHPVGRGLTRIALRPSDLASASSHRTGSLPGPAKIERHLLPYPLSQRHRPLPSAQGRPRPLPPHVRPTPAGGPDRAAAPTRRRPNAWRDADASLGLDLRPPAKSAR